MTEQSSLFSKVKTILEMIRFSHTIFALPFAVLAGILAWNLPETSFSVIHLLGILWCMVMARSAAMAFNRIVDWKIDRDNPRTANRHIPAGLLSVKSVIFFALVCTLGFIAGTLAFLPNLLPLYLSVPVLLFLCGYSYTKRFTSLAHYWLGVALMLAPISAWIAIRGEHVLNNPSDLLPSVFLGAAVLFWVGGFDIIYACQDYEFDKNEGLNSVPTKFGISKALKIAAFSHAISIGMFLLIPNFYDGLGNVYYVGIAAVALLLIYEHSLVKPEDLTRVNIAFFNINAVISMGVLLLCITELWIIPRLM